VWYRTDLDPFQKYDVHTGSEVFPWSFLTSLDWIFARSRKIAGFLTSVFLTVHRPWRLPRGMRQIPVSTIRRPFRLPIRLSDGIDPALP
jgi:hypothetical protein